MPSPIPTSFLSHHQLSPWLTQASSCYLLNNSSNPPNCSQPHRCLNPAILSSLQFCHAFLTGPSLHSCRFVTDFYLLHQPMNSLERTGPATQEGFDKCHLHEGKSQGPWCPVLALFTHLLTFGKNFLSPGITLLI